jgi:hypothetical protein
MASSRGDMRVACKVTCKRSKPLTVVGPLPELSWKHRKIAEPPKIHRNSAPRRPPTAPAALALGGRRWGQGRRSSLVAGQALGRTRQALGQRWWRGRRVALGAAWNASGLGRSLRGAFSASKTSLQYPLSVIFACKSHSCLRTHFISWIISNPCSSVSDKYLHGKFALRSTSSIFKARQK